MIVDRKQSKFYFISSGTGYLFSFFLQPNTKSIILCGIETHACIHHTTLDLLELGYEVASCTKKLNLKIKCYRIFSRKLICGRQQWLYLVSKTIFKAYDTGILCTVPVLFVRNAPDTVFAGYPVRAGSVLRIRDVLSRIPDPDPSICSSRISDPGS
jgi:hypothetical protein